MPSMNANLIVSLIDRVSGPAKRAQASLHGITAAAKTTSVAAAREINRTSRAVMSIVGAVGLYSAHDSYYRFAMNANKLSAANPDFKMADIEKLKKLSFEVSRSTLFKPDQVMGAANALARADVGLNAIMGSLRPLAITAQAADVSIDEMADSFVKLASNFQMPIATIDQARKTFGYLGDLAVYVGQRAPGTINDFVNAMKFVGPAALKAGISIKWLAGAYIMLDKAGIRNEEAGTALRSMVKSLTILTSEARKMYAQLGIDPSKFLIPGKKVSASQMVAVFESEYGKTLKSVAPGLQKILDQEIPFTQKSSLLMKVVERAWGGGMKPVDQRKIKKTIDKFILSSVEKIDPDAWLKTLADSGTTLGQFIRLVEPRQAARLINLLNKELGEDGAQSKLDTKLSDLPGFRQGLAQEAGDKMLQGYPAAVKRLGDAFQSLIESLDKSGAIEGFASTLKAIGDAIVAISNGTAGFKEWAIGLGTALPFIAAITPAFTTLATVVTGVATAIGALVGAVGLLPALGIAAGGAALAYGGWKLYNQAAGDNPGQPKTKPLVSAKDVYRSGMSAIALGMPPPEEPIQSIWSSGAKSIDFLDGSVKAAGAGQKTGEAFKSALEAELRRTDATIAAAVQRWTGMLGFSVSPTITPNISNPPAQRQGGLSGSKHAMHADYGFGTTG